MQSRSTTRVLPALVLGVAGILLAGCAESGAAGATTGLTLAQTKSPVQLLRNETISRIPPAVIDKVTKANDTSVACESKEDDPKGLVRQWRSTAAAIFTSGSEWRLSKVTDDLVKTLTDQKWVARDAGTTASVHRILLTSKTTTAEIQVTAKHPDKGRSSTSKDEIVKDVRIEVETHGPCVATAGPNSDDVKRLEGTH